jgi:hypothetical protein
MCLIQEPRINFSENQGQRFYKRQHGLIYRVVRQDRGVLKQVDGADLDFQLQICAGGEQSCRAMTRFHASFGT